MPNKRVPKVVVSWSALLQKNLLNPKSRVDQFENFTFLYNLLLENNFYIINAFFYIFVLFYDVTNVLQLIIKLYDDL